MFDVLFSAQDLKLLHYDKNETLNKAIGNIKNPKCELVRDKVLTTVVPGCLRSNDQRIDKCRQQCQTKTKRPSFDSICHAIIVVIAFKFDFQQSELRTRN